MKGRCYFLTRKSMKYYIDFDYTLFDTYLFRKELYKILEKNGLDSSYIKLTKETPKNDGNKLLNLSGLFEEISKNKNIPRENLINPLKNLMKKLNEFLYEDTIRFLKTLKDKENEIYLFTYGDIEFQKEKIQNTGIQEYFNGVIYTDDLKFNYKGIDYESSIFIDDSILDIEGFYKNNAYDVIRIKRINGKYSDEKLSIKEIKEYNTLDEYLKSLN